ncbi:MAG: hypothetical protein ABWZ99_15500 [Ilumatobacteraceae bacterium]
MTPEREELLRRLALNDVEALGATLGADLERPETSGLDPKTHALTRVAALVAGESPIASYLWAVESATAAGATDDDVVDVLTAVAAIVGLARLCAAAPQIGLALGYDIEPG